MGDLDGGLASAWMEVSLSISLSLSIICLSKANIYIFLNIKNKICLSKHSFGSLVPEFGDVKISSKVSSLLYVFSLPFLSDLQIRLVTVNTPSH